AISMRTGMTKKRTMRTIAGPRKITKLVRRRAADLAWPPRSIIGSFVAAMVQSELRQPLRDPTGLFDDHVFEGRSRFVDHEVSCILRGQPARFHALQGPEDDAVEIAELRVIGQEPGDLQKLRRPGQRP